MKYILDFDGVIFNTDKLKEEMKELDIADDKRDMSVFDKLSEANPDFSFKEFVNTDALAFIAAHASDCIVVSSAFSETDRESQIEFQKKKIALSGIMDLVGVENVHVVDEFKQDVLHELKQRFEQQQERCVFVDDRERYVKEAQELGIPAVWMDRSAGGVGGFESAPVFENGYRAKNFIELIELMKIWEQKEI